MKYSIPHFTEHVITYSCLHQSWTMLVKGGSGLFSWDILFFRCTEGPPGWAQQDVAYNNVLRLIIHNPIPLIWHHKDAHQVCFHHFHRAYMANQYALTTYDTIYISNERIGRHDNQVKSWSHIYVYIYIYTDGPILVHLQAQRWHIDFEFIITNEQTLFKIVDQVVWNIARLSLVLNI